MQIRAELCHVDTLRCIVRAEAWLDGSLQGSALGEAATAEDYGPSFHVGAFGSEASDPSETAETTETAETAETQRIAER